MDQAYLIRQLERHRDVFRATFEGLGEPEVRWQPAPGQWCLLEIACHLYDEEREDFRARLRSVLEDPAAPLPPADPVRWVSDRRYLEQDFATVVGRFLAERDESVRWLRGLVAPRWTNAHPHPKVGPVTANLFLVNWVAHDLHHIRQVNDRRHGWLAHTSPEPLDYAGKW